MPALSQVWTQPWECRICWAGSSEWMAAAPASLHMYNQIKRMLLCISAQSSDTPVAINPQSSPMALPSALQLT